METKVHSLKIDYSENNFCIYETYQITNKKRMREILNDAFEKMPEYSSKKKIWSYVNQWYVNNKLYKLHLFRKKTINCNFKSKNNILLNITCLILGF